MKKLQIIKKNRVNRRSTSDSRYQNLVVILLFIFLVPYIVSFFFDAFGKQEETELSQETSEVQSRSVKWNYTVGSIEKGEFIVCNKTRAGTEKIPLEDYIARRLPATIPESYEMEALKAQAIVLRTELYRSFEERGRTENGYRYLDAENDMPEIEEESYQRCREAVTATKGMYLCYEKKAIYAPYFPVSAGKTREGSEVIAQKSYPYLKAVVCDRDFTADQYSATVKVSEAVFSSRLKELFPNSKEDIFTADMLTLNRDQSDYVLTVTAGESVISGESFRAVFNLNSSCFTIEKNDGNILIRTKGLGHGLGFGQFDANEKAKNGKDYIEILNWFFSGVFIEKME